MMGLFHRPNPALHLKLEGEGGCWALVTRERERHLPAKGRQKI